VRRLNEKPDCDVCRQIYDKKNEDPPCEKCIPEILPENRDALQVYLLVQNQLVIGGMGEVIDINFESIKFIMELYDIPNKRGVFEKVINVSRFFIKEGRERRNQK